MLHRFVFFYGGAINGQTILEQSILSTFFWGHLLNQYNNSKLFTFLYIFFNIFNLTFENRQLVIL